LIFRKEHIDKYNTLYYLENGMRVIFSKTHNSAMVHCGYIIGAGSRDENQLNNGIAHFIEHTAFKGTEKRKSFQILNRIEAIGGELNAYTSREKTCFYSSTLKRYFDRSVDLLTDIVFRPVFPPLEIEKEKSVIIEEIEMYEDNPEESIYDDFYSRIFEGNSLGYSVLGKKQTVKKITFNTISDFRNNFYQPFNMVFSINGNISSEKVEKVIVKHLAPIGASQQSKPQRKRPDSKQSFTKYIKKDYQQVHCIIGFPAYSMHQDKKFEMVLLNNYLGGDWMSSKLNMIIREKYAFAYSISSNYNAYSDTGLYSIQFGTDGKYIEKSIELINKELIKLKAQALSPVQLNKAKRQIFGQYEMIKESKSAMMQIKGNNVLDYGLPLSEEEYYRHINAVTSASLLQVANEVLDEKNMSILVYHKKSIV
jgi:predicted Zn-dependent peptidase